MVTQYGMTERLGAIRYGQEQGEVFLGRDMGHSRDYSEEIAAAIDEEVRSFIETAHQEAYEVLVANRHVLDALVVDLLEKETLDKEQVARVFEYRQVGRNRFGAREYRYFLMMYANAGLPGIEMPGATAVNGFSGWTPWSPGW
jgi:hypothetical protein